MNTRLFIVLTLGLAVLGVYFFVTAPAPLPEPSAHRNEPTLSVAQAFEMLNHENDVARALYAQEIVGKGQAAGLSFNERWKDEGIEAGPLPALFLRETAGHLVRSPLQLRLFLGAAAPINTSNAFKKRQLEEFSTLVTTRAPRFFVDGTARANFAMFPDVATVSACAECHNKHPDSPKTDWQVGDVMGATTWSLPRASVTHEELRDLLMTLRAAFRASYETYLLKTKSFARPPEVGAKWPAEGYALPSADVFMTELERRSSAGTLQLWLRTGETRDAGGAR